MPVLIPVSLTAPHVPFLHFLSRLLLVTERLFFNLSEQVSTLVLTGEMYELAYSSHPSFAISLYY